MEITSEQMEGGVTRVELDGRMDREGAQAVDMKINIIAGRATKLLIDLQKVTYIGSLGIGTIVVPARTVVSRGGKVVFFRPTGIVATVLKTSHIQDLFPFHDDLAEALAALH